MSTFKAVNWTPNEYIGEAKMDQMTNNAEWLLANTPRAVYTLPGGLRRAEGIKLASGRAIISKSNSDSATVEVRFGNFFSTRCEPNVTTGIVSQQKNVFCSIQGLGKNTPDARGFQIQVNIDANSDKKDKITNTMYVFFSAMGY